MHSSTTVTLLIWFGLLFFAGTIAKGEPTEMIGWDHENPDVIGKIVLVGVTYLAADGSELDRGQWWGRIVAFNRKDGLKVDLANKGTVHAFPPFREAMSRAKPGIYELNRTGEKIEDPDYLYTVRTQKPAE